MAKVPMIAQQAMTYATRRLLPGDTFEADHEQDAEVCRVLFNALDADKLKPKVARLRLTPKTEGK